MSSMKKLISLVLALVCVLSLASCKEDTASTDTEKDKSSASTKDTSKDTSKDTTPADTDPDGPTNPDDPTNPDNPTTPDDPTDPGQSGTPTVDDARALLAEGKHVEAYVLLTKLADSDPVASNMLRDFHVVYEKEKETSEGYLCEYSFTYDKNGYPLKTVTYANYSIYDRYPVTNEYEGGKLVKSTYTIYGETTERSYFYDTNGRLTKSIDRMFMTFDGEIEEWGSVTTEYYYNDDGRVMCEVIDGWQSINYEYDAYGNVTKMIEIYNSYDEYVTVYENTLDEKNRVIKSKITESSADGDYEYTYFAYYTYDDEGRVLSDIRDYDEGMKEGVAYSYDEHGNMCEIAMVMMGESEDTNIYEYTYSADGKLVSMRQQMYDGGTLYVEYDSYGNVTLRESIDSEGVVYSKEIIVYNDKGTLLSEEMIQDGERIYILEYFYDSEGREAKTTRSYGDGYVEIYEYEYNGKSQCVLERYKSTDPDGKVNDSSYTEYTYDERGYLLDMLKDGRGVLTYRYDDNGNVVYYSYSTYFGFETIYYEYDAQGRCVSEKHYEDGEFDREVVYSYDAEGKTTNTVVTYNDGSSESGDFTYDENGFVVRIECENSDGELEVITVEGWLVFYRPGNIHNENYMDYYLRW